MARTRTLGKKAAARRWRPSLAWTCALVGALSACSADSRPKRDAGAPLSGVDGGTTAVCGQFVYSGDATDECIGTKCCAELTACVDAPECVAYEDCVTLAVIDGGTMDPSKECAAQHPNGTAVAKPYNDCYVKLCVGP